MRRKRMPVGFVDVKSSHDYHDKHDRDLYPYHGRVKARALSDSDDKDDSDQRGDEDCWKVYVSPGQSQLSGGSIIVERRVGEMMRNLYAKHIEKILEVMRPSMGDSGRADSVLENQVPADNPREKLPKRRVGIGVSRAGHRDH